jgi:hypothetical protein
VPPPVPRPPAAAAAAAAAATADSDCLFSQIPAAGAPFATPYSKEERSGTAERMERSDAKRPKTCSYLRTFSLVDIVQLGHGELADMIIKPLDPLYAEDLDSLDSSALISLLDAHPAFRALMPAPDREWLRFNQYLLPQVIQFATRPVDAQFVIAAYDMGERYRGDPHLQWLCSTRGARGVYPYTSDDASALMQDMPQLGDRAVILLGCTEEELKRTRGRCRRHAAFETSATRIRDMMASSENDTEDADSAP